MRALYTDPGVYMCECLILCICVCVCVQVMVYRGSIDSVYLHEEYALRTVTEFTLGRFAQCFFVYSAELVLTIRIEIRSKM